MMRRVKEYRAAFDISRVIGGRMKKLLLVFAVVFMAISFIEAEAATDFSGEIVCIQNQLFEGVHTTRRKVGRMADDIGAIISHVAYKYSAVGVLSKNEKRLENGHFFVTIEQKTKDFEFSDLTLNLGKRDAAFKVKLNKEKGPTNVFDYVVDQDAGGGGKVLITRTSLTTFDFRFVGGKFDGIRVYFRKDEKLFIKI